MHPAEAPTTARNYDRKDFTMTLGQVAPQVKSFVPADRVQLQLGACSRPPRTRGSPQELSTLSSPL
jgi:hypothetical protein